MKNFLQGVPKKCNPPFFPLFLQTSLSNIKNDFMVKKNDMLEINYYSFNQIRSSMSKLWGKVWHLYHFTPTQCKTYGEDWFWVSQNINYRYQKCFLVFTIIFYYHMPTAHSLLWLVRSWSYDHLTKLILGCNITFQHSDSELSGLCAQFSTWTLEKEPNRSELRQGIQRSFGLL